MVVVAVICLKDLGSRLDSEQILARNLKGSVTVRISGKVHAGINAKYFRWSDVSFYNYTSWMSFFLLLLLLTGRTSSREGFEIIY